MTFRRCLPVFFVAAVALRSGLCAATPKPLATDALVISRAKFTQLVDAALAWVSRHPASPQSPRLLARVIMAASVRGDDGSQLMVAQRRLLTCFPLSLESRYWLAMTPSAKAYRTATSEMLYWYGSKPDRRRALAVDHLLRVGLRRFALAGIYKGQFSNAMLCYLAARQAGDAAVADEMLGCTEPSSADKKYAAATAEDEIRELVLNQGISAQRKLTYLSLLGRYGAVSPLQHYYLHRLPPALRHSAQGLRIEARVLVFRKHFKRALALLAQAQAHHHHNARAEFMQTYCNAVLGRAGPAASAAARLRRDFPQSRWLAEASQLAKVAAAAPTADMQLTRFLLTRLHWAGRKLTGMQIQAAFTPATGAPWHGYCGVANGQLTMQIWHHGHVAAALASNHGTSRIFDPRQGKTFVFRQAAKVPATSASPNAAASLPTQLANILATLGSRELSARGLLNQYLPASLKTYVGVQTLFKLLHENGGFVLPATRRGDAITYAIIFAGIDKPGLKRIAVTVRRGGSAISIRCGQWAVLHVTTSASKHFRLSPPPWPPGPVVQVKKRANASLEAMAILVQSYLPAGIKALAALATRPLPGLREQIPALMPHCYVPDGQRNAPPFAGSSHHPLSAGFLAAAPQRAAATLVWAKLHANSNAAPARLFHAIMLAKVSGHPRLRGRIERWLILHDGASLQGHYDLQRFSTPTKLGRLIQALLDANAVRMTRRRAVEVMRVVYYAMEQFNQDKKFLDLFGTGHHVAAAFCAGVAAQIGWTKFAASLNSLVAKLAQSDKTLAAVRRALSQPGLTNQQRIQMLAAVGKSRQAAFLAAYLLVRMGRANYDPATKLAAALIYLRTNHLHRALACAQELPEKEATAHLEFIRVDCQMRLGQARAARKTALHALKMFPQSKWRKDLRLLSEACMSVQKNQRFYAAALLRVDQWLIHNAWGVEITGKLSAPGISPWTFTVAGQRRFWQLYAEHGGEPVVAIRGTRHGVYMLSPTRPLIRVVRGESTVVGFTINERRRAQGRARFSMDFGSSARSYAFMPLRLQLCSRYFHTAAGIRQLVATHTTGDLLLAPTSSKRGETFTVVAISPKRPQQYTCTFRVGRDGRPQSIHLGTNIAVRFHFLIRRGQHFHGLPWPSYKVVVVKGGSAAVMGQWIDQLGHAMLALEKMAVAKPTPALPSLRR